MKKSYPAWIYELPKVKVEQRHFGTTIQVMDNEYPDRVFAIRHFFHLTLEKQQHFVETVRQRIITTKQHELDIYWGVK